MDGPIPYSKFVKPDDSLTNLIKQMETVMAGYTAMAASIKADSAAILKSFKDTNTAGKEGKETTKKTTERVDELTRAHRNLAKAQSAEGKELARLKSKLAQQNQLNKLNVKLNESAVGSYNRLSAQYSLNKIKLNALSKTQREATVSGKKLEAETKAIYTEMKRLQENTGKTTLNVGNYGDALSALPGPLAGAAAGTKALGAQFKKLLRNPIVALIALIAGTLMVLVSAMKRSEDGENRLNKVMTIASSIFDNIMDILTAFGIALFDTIPKALKRAGNKITIFANMTKMAFMMLRKQWLKFIGKTEKANAVEAELLKLGEETRNLIQEQKRLSTEINKSFSVAINKVKNLGSEIKKDIAAAIVLANLIAKFNEDERTFIVENAKLNKKAAEARGKAEKLKLLDAKASIQAMKESFVFDEKVLENELKIAKAHENILKKTSDLAEDRIEDKKAIAEAEAKVFDIETRFEELRRQRTRRLNMIRKEGLRQEEERAKAFIKIGELEKAAQIRANREIINSDLISSDIRFAASLETAQLESDLIRKTSDLEIKSLDERKNLKLINEKDYAIQRQLIESIALDGINKINEKHEKDIKIITDTGRKRDEKLKEDSIKSAQDEFDAKMEIIEQEFELRTSEIDLMKTIEAKKTTLVLLAEKERFEKILQLNKLNGAQLTKLQIETIKNLITGINKEISDSAKNNMDIYTALGINLEDDQKAAIQESVSYVADNIAGMVDMRVEAADRILQKTREEADESQSIFDQEIQNRNDGFANRVIQAQKELELNRKKEEEALKQKKKAQKAQAAIDSLTQTSSLITASVQIWKALAGIPIIGPALAATAVGAMFSSFAISKIKAKALTKDKFGDGNYEVLQGGSHASGNDISLGMMKSGKQRTAEGGEGMAIFKKSSTRKYSSILPKIVDSINKGSFEYDFGNVNQGSSTTILNQNYDSPELRNMDKNIGVLARNSETQRYTDADGRLVEQYKNVTTTYV